MKKIAIALGVIFASVSVMLLEAKADTNASEVNASITQINESVGPLENYRGKIFTMGLTRVVEHVLPDEFVEVMQEHHGITIKPVVYETAEQLQVALDRGEVDFTSTRENESDTNLYKSVVRIPSITLGISNVDNPLFEVANVRNRRVGSIRGSNLQNGAQLVHGKDHFESFEFDTLEEGLIALEKKEIDLFMSREYMRHELIERKNLQIEFSYREEIVPLQFATNEESSVRFIEGLRYFFQEINALEVDKNISNRYIYNLKSKMREYLNENHASVINAHNSINVAMNSSYFPYSYLSTNGEIRGIYPEMLEMLTNLTGIEYNVVNRATATNFSNYFDKLSDNDIHFMFGVTNENSIPNLEVVGNTKVDSIIAIVRTGEENIINQNIENSFFGTMRPLKGFIPYILDTYYYTEFTDYDEAFYALMDGEIDALIGYRSTLNYYQNVRGYTAVNSSAVIERPGVRGVLGNQGNSDLNDLMAEIERLYSIVHVNDYESKWEKELVNYQHAYRELVLQREKRTTLYYTLGISSLVILSSGIAVMGRKRSAKLKREKEIDELTGLLNRSAYKEKCLKLIEKHPGKLGVFFFIDLNEFKTVNDLYGHSIGDKLLNRFGEILMTLSDETTIPFRIAGDEFGIFKMGISKKSDVLEEVQKVETVLSGNLFRDQEITIPLQCSIGAAAYNLDSHDFDTVMEYSDIAMYRAKEKKNHSEADVAMEVYEQTSF